MVVFHGISDIPIRLSVSCFESDQFVALKSACEKVEKASKLLSKESQQDCMYKKGNLALKYK